jgi:uncharacterized CHY-type Zn-finger protein
VASVDNVSIIYKSRESTIERLFVCGACRHQMSQGLYVLMESLAPKLEYHTNVLCDTALEILNEIEKRIRAKMVPVNDGA